MKNVLVENYMHTLPQMLGNIYDELMQPLPDVLESILSPDKSGSESVFRRSLLSCEPDNNLDTSLDVISASQPVKSDVLLDRTKRNSRSRKLIHHPSLADMGSQRQIVVTNKLPTEKKKSRKSSKSKVKKDFKSPPFKSPSRRKKIIAETPSHKQKARHVWKQQEKERRRSHTVTDVKVVTESPIKSDIIKDSPSQHKKALHLVRRSFYSAGPIRRTRSLAHSLQIADKISGRKRQLSGRLSSILLHNSPAVSKVELKSPDKNSSFLLSQLMGSPTTPNSRKTPKKARGTTPAKLVGESPSMHTRSKSPAAFSVGKPKALFQDSPMKQFKEPEEKSHRAVGGSAKKSQVFGFPSISSPQTVTPRKTLVPDLQSPSQNTRSKVSSTPTRQSVRAALFCKSPELKYSNHKIEKGNIESPSRSNKQPFTKRKSAVVSDEAILKDQDSEFYSFQLINPSEENHALVSEQENTQVSWLNEKGEECRISFTEAQNPPLVKGNTPKTPSSMKGKKTRTPTSLDKWPRIKSVRNSSEKSKSNLSKSLFRNVADESSININSQNNNIFSELSQNQNSSQLSQDSVCSVSKKRGLQLSPESNLTSFSPSKRQKCSDSGYPSSSDSRASMVCDQSKVNTRLSYCLHSRILSRKMSSIASSEGFSTVNSQNIGSQPSVSTLSQTSQPSIGSLSQTSWRSEDCFSATNDEVFINNSQFDQTNNSQSDQIDNVQADENDKFFTERSESPIFGSSRKRKYIASPENNVTENNTEVTNPAQDDVINSTSKVSPSSRKFSPNVSAKSLMHLMNSPLLKSPHDLGRKLSNPISPDNLNIRRRRISGRSSRRSLNLQK
ncbi:hypothetical protein FSP39_018754 [Pinctada imbricata]|uniref:Uncharacterized protein n=1 Tax=Pinctada imbricata TaxID=66713 RepID=A0AA88YK07_PINIB|nr:hypothetical protein FSP39_018754 [Pinctada imbricata]